MALSKHGQSDSSNQERNETENPGAASDKSFSGNDEHQLLNDENVQEGKEKYIRDVANIEDVRGNGGEPVEENSKHLTDVSGEEKNEEYINTDERKKDLDQAERNRGL